jgi:hypothetical protein
LLNPTFASGLDYPTGLALDKSGNLYVASYSSGSVEEIGSSGNVINANFISGLGAGPESLAFDPMGDLYVGNNGNGTIEQFDGSGNLLNPFFASAGSGAEYIAFSVPEPAAWSFAVLGIGAVLGLRRRS